MSEPGTPAAPPRWRRVVRLAGFVVIGLGILAAPMWAPPILARLAFFRLRKIEVTGVRYLDAARLAAQLGVDTTKSIWIDLGPLEERLSTHPQIAEVNVGRRLPGTIVVRVTEHQPIALVPTRSGLEVVDVRGVVLPVDPTRTEVNLPIASHRDTTLLRLLAGIRSEQPGLFARISEARRVGRDEIRLQLAGLAVLAMMDVTVQRLADILPVERDLASKRIQAAELDLRYRERVIARLP